MQMLLKIPGSFKLLNVRDAVIVNEELFDYVFVICWNLKWSNPKSQMLFL